MMRYNRAWLFVISGGIVEAVWPALMNVSDGLTDFAAAALGFLFSVVATLLLYMGLHRGLPVGPSYATWVGIGVAGITAIDIVAFGLSLNLLQYLFFFMILCGVVGLNLFQGKGEREGEPLRRHLSLRQQGACGAQMFNQPSMRSPPREPNAILFYMSNNYDSH